MELELKTPLTIVNNRIFRIHTSTCLVFCLMIYFKNITVLSSYYTIQFYFLE